MSVTDVSQKEQRLAHLRRKLTEADHEIRLLESVLPPAPEVKFHEQRALFADLERQSRGSGPAAAAAVAARHALLTLATSEPPIEAPRLVRVEGAQLPLIGFAPIIVRLP